MIVLVIIWMVDGGDCRRGVISPLAAISRHDDNRAFGQAKSAWQADSSPYNHIAEGA